MAWVFGAWGAIVERCTLLVFIISLAGFGYAGYGLRYAKLYGSKDFVFAPTVSKLDYLSGLPLDGAYLSLHQYDRATEAWTICSQWKKFLAGLQMRSARST